MDRMLRHIHSRSRTASVAVVEMGRRGFRNIFIFLVAGIVISHGYYFVSLSVVPYISRDSHSPTGKSAAVRSIRGERYIPVICGEALEIFAAAVLDNHPEPV